MDEEMEEAFEGGDFLSLEVDLDYEFHASRYFDFSRIESASETREVERWFETAGSYPPSPFMAKIYIGKDIITENVNTLPKHKDMDLRSCIGAHSDVTDPEFSVLVVNDNCETIYSEMSHDNPKPETRFISKGPFTRCSTLMKPTASQLAKQRQAIGVTINSQFLHRFQKPQRRKHDSSYDDPLHNKTQAAKRQKLDGGHFRRVQEPDDVMLQTHLMHKVPQKKKDPVDCSSEPFRLKITIPREFQLGTTRRSQRIRPGNSNGSQESAAPTTFVFKAHPINRKILEAPSLPLPQKSTPRLPEFQEFHLRTLERATQHKPSSSSSLVTDRTPSSAQQGCAIGSERLQHQANELSQLQKLRFNNEPMGNECENTLPKFKARPLNKKILSSKGDIGVFRSRKCESTRPMGFNFATDKRCHQGPPVELFNKLSLTSEARNNSESQTKNPRPVCVPIKVSKENIVDSTIQKIKNTCVSTEEQQGHRISLIKFERSGVVTDWRSRPNMSRSLGIR